MNQFDKKTLFCLKSDGSWINVNLNHEKYSAVYQFILKILNQNEGKGKDIKNKKQTVSFDTIKIDIQKIESHRCCTILQCVQYDTESQGLRFLVYGTKYNLDSDYGIGTHLNDITPDIILSKTKLDYFNQIAKFLD